MHRYLMRRQIQSGAVRFRHPLLRSAAYHHAGPGWRTAAHGRAAAELRRREAPVAEQAVHVEASATVGDLEAVQLLRTAAQEALRITPATAAHWLRAADALLPRQAATTATRIELLHLPDGRALISFDESTNIPALELTIQDALDDRSLPESDRAVFEAIRGILRTARRSDKVTLLQKNVIVLETGRNRK